MYDLQSGQSTQVAAHDAPIKSVRWIDSQNGILATGSWDKTIKVRSSLSYIYNTMLISLSSGIYEPQPQS